MPSLGTISGLGIGSKLDLQGTLDKLHQVDNDAVTGLQAKETKAKAHLVAFDDVNAKFLAVKTNALSLSLDSNFLTKKFQAPMIVWCQPRSFWASLTRRVILRWDS